MRERLVLCGGAEYKGKRPKDGLSLAILGSQSNIKLRLDDISRRMVANVPALLTDLVEIATYVLCADEAVTRGGDARIALGARWRRRFRFVIPVRSPQRWSSPGIADALTDVLAFLSDDEFHFEFERYTKAPPFQTYLGLVGGAPATFEADEILLFSGGMDSLGGAIHELDAQHHRVALVSHHSSSKMYERQRYLAHELAKRFPGKVMHIPVLVTQQNALKAVDNTQRTRTFLFAALAMAVATIMGRRRIRFYENGVVSFNLPIAGQVVGTQATRSTHPRVIRDLARFLTLLLEEDIVVENPFAWKTKSDVARLIRSSAHCDLAQHSVSCSHVHGMTRLHPHCGTCFQCLDRRFAALDADLGDDDPVEMYRVDLLTGEREEGEERTMAEAYVRRALEFRRMTDVGFLGQCIGEISRGAFAFPGMSADEVARSAFHLHKRHGESVHSVLTKAVRTYADDLVGGALPSHCILRMAVGAHGRDFDDAPIGVPSVTTRPDATAMDTRNYRQTSEIRLAVETDTQQVLIHGLPPVRGGANHALVSALLLKYEEDRRAGRAPERYRYTAAPNLAAELAIGEQTLRRRVSRLRRTFAGLCVDYLGFPLDQNAIIETKGWQGYRINPAVRIVASAAIESTRHIFPIKKSQHGPAESLKSMT
jgi:7-cyano-7-deazaguanine synthase in queuosine biosynthesis